MRPDFSSSFRYNPRRALSSTFSDVVLCMEAWRAGYRGVYTPYGMLVHRESYTRLRNESSPDMVLLAQYLQTSGFEEDRWFHPELDPKSATAAVRPPFEPPARVVIRNYVERVLAAAPAGLKG